MTSNLAYKLLNVNMYTSDHVIKYKSVGVGTKEWSDLLDCTPVLPCMV